MSVLGVIFGIVAILASIMGIVVGLPGAVFAGVLGLAAVVIGILAKRKTNKGTRTIVVGAMAIVLAVVMASAGITFTTKLIEQAKACPDKAPTIARYADKLNPSMALLSFYTCAENKEDVDLMTNELTALMKDMEKTAPAAAEVPAVNAESTQG